MRVIRNRKKLNKTKAKTKKKRQQQKKKPNKSQNKTKSDFKRFVLVAFRVESMT